VAGSCEHCNEPSGSIEGGEFRDKLSLLASQEGLCSMELVMCCVMLCCRLSLWFHAAVYIPADIMVYEVTRLKCS